MNRRAILTPLPPPSQIDLATELEQSIAQAAGLLALLTDRAIEDPQAGTMRTPLSDVEIFGVELLKEATTERLQDVFKALRPALMPPSAA